MEKRVSGRRAAKAAEKGPQDLFSSHPDPRLFIEDKLRRLLLWMRDFLGQRSLEAYLVGGPVRDAILGRTSHDVDIAVGGDALAVARQAADELGGSLVVLDEAHEIARVIQRRHGEQWHVDLSALRGTIQEDLASRDFTVDAMAVRLGDIAQRQADTPLIDPYDGYGDLEKKTIRAVDESAFAADPARLVRAVRLSQELGFTIEPQTETLISENHALVARVSGERLRDELCRILGTPGADTALRHLDRLGLLTAIIPELEAARGAEQPKEHYWNVLEHSFETVGAVEQVLPGEQGETPLSLPPPLVDYFAEEVSGGHSRAVLLKLAALLHDIAKPQTKTIEESGRMRFLGHGKLGAEVVGQVMERLRFSSRETRMVQLMIQHHLRPGQLAADELPSRRAIYRYFRDTAEAGIDILFLSLADHLATRGPSLDTDDWLLHARRMQYLIDRWHEEKTIVAPPKLVDGHLLMERFDLSPGPLIGELLEAVREAQAAGEIETKEQALEFVTQRLRSS